MRKKALIVNQAKEDSSAVLKEVLEKDGIPLGGFIPEDPMVYEYDMKGLPTVTLPDDAPAVKEAFRIFEQLVDNYKTDETEVKAHLCAFPPPGNG